MNYSYLVVILVFFALIIMLWFNNKKVAVQSKGSAKTSGIYILYFAFMGLTGVLSLSDKLLNLLLTKIDLSVLDPSQPSAYKGMMFATFIVLAIVMLIILKKASVNENVSDHLIEASQRKNKEIDVLKEKLANTFSEDERIHLSTKINQLQAALKSTEQAIKTLKEQLEKYSPDIEIVKEANNLLKQEGIDKALAYLESQNFKKTLKASQQHAKALLTKAVFYSVKNQYKKANKTFLRSIRLHRSVDNTITYANYLSDQNKIIECIKQLLLLNIESETLAEYEKASVLGSLANAYQKNNQRKEAEKAYDEALGIFRSLWKESPSVYLPNVALMLNNLAIFYDSDNRLNEAEKAYDESLGIYRSLSKENPNAYFLDIAGTLNNLALLYHSDNRLKEAETVYDEVLGIYRALWKENPRMYLPSVAATLNNLGVLYGSDNRLKDAEKAYDEALGIRRSLAKENPCAYFPDVAVTLTNLGVLYGSDNRLNEAEKSYDEALGVRRSLAKENPSAYLPDIAKTLNNLAILYRSDNRLKKAEKAYDEALGIYRDLAKKAPNIYGIDLADTVVTGVTLINQPRKNLKEARAILLKCKGISQADTLLLTIDRLEGE